MLTLLSALGSLLYWGVYLSPAVLDSLLLKRRTSAVPIDRLAAAALLPWAEEPAAVFDD